MSRLKNSLEIVPSRLFFAWLDAGQPAPSSSADVHCFSVEQSMRYQAFFADFGPLHLGHVYRFCVLVKELLQTHKQVLFYCSSHPHARTNSAVLVLAYSVIVLKKEPHEAYAPFVGLNPPLFPFRDAGFSLCTFHLTAIDCTRAIHRAVSLGHFNLSSFNIDEFEHLQKLHNGDVSWIIPGKFIAFSGPQSRKVELESGVFTMSAEEYVPLFSRLGVSCVVRFNTKCYDRNVFVRAGIQHVDLYYEDGGNPTVQILNSFIDTCERATGAIAVHCKAGLGRTGTNIVAYMMKHYGYTAREGIAWTRICRPGSVVGMQQQFLVSIEDRMRLEGRTLRERQLQPTLSSNMLDQLHLKYSIMSPKRATTAARNSGYEVGFARSRPTTSMRSPARPLSVRGSSSRTVRQLKQPERQVSQSQALKLPSRAATASKLSRSDAYGVMIRGRNR